jgi:predicted metal-dependent enzyme (double-stranded beta helix superfamily)
MTQASAVHTRCPADLVAAIRAATARHADWQQTAELVADALRRHLPGPGILTAEEAAGSQDGYVSHTLHTEYEELFSLRDGDTALGEVGRSMNETGAVGGFAPPGDIHRVRNHGTDVAISLHVYGADIARLGSSVRRTYDLPVVTLVG